MKEKHIGKILAIGIIVLFIGAGVISSAVNLNTDVKDETRENPETEPLDEYTEIISYVWGSAAHRNKTGLFSVNFTDGIINIISYTTSGFYSKKTDHVYMNFFIGFYPSSGFPVNYNFFGIAMGNIDW